MMNKQDILKKIGNIINELNEQHQYLSSTPKINILELELFTANADFLIDHIEILKKINNHVPELAAPEKLNEARETSFYTPIQEPEEQVIIEKTVEEQPIEVVFEEIDKPEKALPVADEPVAEVEEAKTPLFKFDFEEPTEMVFDFEKNIGVQETFDRELTQEEQELIEDKTKALTEVEPVFVAVEEENNNFEEEEIGEEPFIIQKPEVENTQPVTEVKQEPASNILPNSLENGSPKEARSAEPEKVPSLNEILSGKMEQKQVNLKPITDLKSSISLNDKMFFIKELFNGYNLAYSEAIEILNRFDSFEAADNFLMKNYAEKNNWAAKQDTVDRLYEILNRKFKS